MMEEPVPFKSGSRKSIKTGVHCRVLKSAAKKCRGIAENVMDDVRTKIGVKPGWL
jgi:hypothetical protein